MKHKWDLTKGLKVLKINIHYKAPYAKRNIVYITRSDIRNKNKFQEHLQTMALAWDNGEYELYAVKKGFERGLGLKNYEIFVKFKVKNAKVVKLFTHINGRKLPATQILA